MRRRVILFLCEEIWIYMLTSTLPSQLRGSGRSNILLTVSTAQTLASKCHGLLYEPGLLREMADLRALTGKGQLEMEHLFVPKDKDVPKE